MPHSSTFAYSRLCLPFIVRKCSAQIQLGGLPIKIENDRYLKIPSDKRICIQPKCKLDNDDLIQIKMSRTF